MDCKIFYSYRFTFRAEDSRLVRIEEELHKDADPFLGIRCQGYDPLENPDQKTRLRSLEK